MAKCKICGEWAGVFQHVHDSCREGKPKNPEPQFTSRPRDAVTSSTIAVGIFWGLWMFYLSAALVTLFFYEVFR